MSHRVPEEHKFCMVAEHQETCHQEVRTCSSVDISFVFRLALPIDMLCLTAHFSLSFLPFLISYFLWSLFFNDSKCISMSFSSSQPSINSSYHIAGNSVKQLNFHRDLGIILQENLKWEHHYDSISAKAYQKLGLIKRTFSTSNSISTKKQLYLSLVRSQLSYGSQLWRPMLIKHIVSLEKIQRRATKFTTLTCHIKRGSFN